MANFKGFNTIDQDKKFTLTDYELIKRDLLNAFNIREGEMPGRPDVGTVIWSYLFDPNDSVLEQQVEEEITRVINADPRTEVRTIQITQNHNVLNAEVKLYVSPDQDIETLYLSFSQATQKATAQ
jgi:phage baseplate assembly protein W